MTGFIYLKKNKENLHEEHAGNRARERHRRLCRVPVGRTRTALLSTTACSEIINSYVLCAHILFFSKSKSGCLRPFSIEQ